MSSAISLLLPPNPPPPFSVLIFLFLYFAVSPSLCYCLSSSPTPWYLPPRPVIEIQGKYQPVAHYSSVTSPLSYSHSQPPSLLYSSVQYGTVRNEPIARLFSGPKSTPFKFCLLEQLRSFTLIMHDVTEPRHDFCSC